MLVRDTAKLTAYKDLYTYRQQSLLPPHVQTATFELARALWKQSITAEHVTAYRRGLEDLPASAITQAAKEIRDIAELHYNWHDEKRKRAKLFSKLFGWFRSSTPQVTDLLNTHPGLAWLLLFHGDGYIRQKALEKLDHPPASEFEFAAIISRLNDWVGNVRSAAVDYTQLHFPATAESVVGEASFFLLPYSSLLVRWEEREQQAFQKAIYRPDVLDYLKNQFLMERLGHVGVVLKRLLEHPGFDHHLEELARSAFGPNVRAVAMNVLLKGQYRRFLGYKHVWLEEAWGVATSEPDYATRELDIPIDFEALLGIAYKDKSVKVRRMAADGLISKLKNATSKMDEIAQVLHHDKDPAVRDRIDFYFRKRKDLEETE